MDVSFKDTKLAKTCNSEKALVKAYGKANARKIMLRLTLLEAAEALSDVPVTPPTRRHELKGNRKGKFAIDVQHPFRIVFEPRIERSIAPLASETRGTRVSETSIRVGSVG